MSTSSAPVLAHHSDGSLTHQCDFRNTRPGRDGDKIFQGWVDKSKSEKSGKAYVLIPISSHLPDDSLH